jgi:chromosome segregation ATPase
VSDYWWLKTLTIEGFRGYIESRSLDVSEPFVLLEGPQRSGKSSTLTAIEWGLFGDEIANKQIGIDERKGWQVRNRSAAEVRVEIVLTKGNDTLKVVRSDIRKRSSPNFYFELNGVERRDEGELRALLGIEPKDYFSSVHLHQEVVRALLTETPASRRDMLDRLLGLSELRNIIDGIKAAKLSEALKDADRKFEGIEQTLNALVTSKRREIEQAKEVGTQKGLGPDDFSETAATRICEEVKTALTSFAKASGLPTPSLPSTTSVEARARLPSLGREALRSLRDEQPDLERQKRFLTRQLHLQTLQQDYEASTRQLRELNTEKEHICQSDGNREALGNRISTELEPKLKDARNRANEVNRRVSTIQEAIKYFDAVDTTTRAEVLCPVCEELVENVQHLQVHLSEILEGFGEDLAPIQEEIELHEAEIKRLQELIVQLDELDLKIVAQSGQVATQRSNVEAELGRKIKDTEDPAALVRAKLANIEEELEKLAAAVRESNKKLNAVEDSIISLEQVLKVLELEADIVGLLDVTESEEYQKVEDAKQALEDFAADLDLIRQAVEAVLQESATAKLEAAGERIDKIFGELANRPDFSGLEIDPGSFEILVVENGERLPAVPILNHGDMNCAAISVFLGLGTAPGVSHKLGFVILDDPSQSLDSVHEVNLLRIINTLPEDRQVWISTSEGHLAGLARTGITRKKKCYKFEPWSDTTGACPREDE